MDNNALFFQIFNLHGHSLVLDKLMVFGAVYLIYLVFLLVVLLGVKGGIKEKKAVLLLILGIPIAILLIKMIHLGVREPRPFVNFHFSPVISESTDASFPSRHATISAVIGFSFAYFKSKWAWLFLFLMLWVGISRVFVGVHYPLDIIGGFLTAIISLILALQVKKILASFMS